MTSESLRARAPGADEERLPALEPPPAPRSLGRWLAVFGPGAIIASLTIGTGELVFSSRAGALFGFDVLWLFFLTCVLKWVLLYGAARHMVLCGVHPFERYARLPGPRGWFPLTLLLLAAVAFPIWVGFVGGVLGTLLEGRFGLDAHLSGIVATALAVLLVLRGGYDVLERVQLFVVAALLLAVGLSLVLMRPDWLAVAKGLFVPAFLEYPRWLPSASEELAARPVALEVATYVGVIGGSAYDYLAYVAFLRNKSWGLSSHPVRERSALERISQSHGDLLNAKGPADSLHPQLQGHGVAELVDGQTSQLRSPVGFEPAERVGQSEAQPLIQNLRDLPIDELAICGRDALLAGGLQVSRPADDVDG